MPTNEFYFGFSQKKQCAKRKIVRHIHKETFVSLSSKWISIASLAQPMVQYWLKKVQYINTGKIQSCQLEGKRNIAFIILAASYCMIKLPDLYIILTIPYRIQLQVSRTDNFIMKRNPDRIHVWIKSFAGETRIFVECFRCVDWTEWDILGGIRFEAKCLPNPFKHSTTNTWRLPSNIRTNNKSDTGGVSGVWASGASDIHSRSESVKNLFVCLCVCLAMIATIWWDRFKQTCDETGSLAQNLGKVR